MSKNSRAFVAAVIGAAIAVVLCAVGGAFGGIEGYFGWVGALVLVGLMTTAVTVCALLIVAVAATFNWIERGSERD